MTAPTALSAAQICTLANQIAKTPNFASQVGQLFNAVHEELSYTYNLDVFRGTFNFPFIPGLLNPIPGTQLTGSGPYPLPADYLRAEPEDVFWVLNGVPYILISIDLAEFDRQVQVAGLQSYPYYMATDMSQSPPVAYFYAPPSGAYPVFGRYKRLMPNLATPQTSAGSAYFPMSSYLITRLAGEMCKLAGDDRWIELLGDRAHGAQGILDRFLKLEGDRLARAKSVSLDRRRFGRHTANLPNTKQVGW